jgi:flavorubredoxin
MKAVKITDNIYWVGAIDWNLRNFHGYLTQRGSTYNAYLIIDEKVTLLDTVKAPFFNEMFDRISSVIDPEKIDYLVSNHTEMDHSGALPQIMKAAPNATVVASPKGEKHLKRHYGEDLAVTTIKNGDTLSLGTRSLAFALTPMVHWPDNMVTYMPEEKILFSNDAFGQHISSSERFDDQYPLEIIIEEARKYYANIVLPYGAQVQKALEALKGLEIETICPSHGLIWRNHIAEILERYNGWCTNETGSRAVILYDTMWGSTEKIARELARSFEDKGIEYQIYKLQETHISDIMTDIIDARYICVGSPTLNSSMLPTVASFLTYMKGLSPKKRVGVAFGSYGWGGQGVMEVDSMLQACGFDMMEPIKINFVPTDEELRAIAKEFVSKL